ncbi:hypothetical protein D3C73_1149310 [compost metagenome]
MLAHHGALSNNERVVDLLDQYHCKKIMLPLSKERRHHPNGVVLKNILERPENQLFCPVGLKLPLSLNASQVKFGNLIEI